MAGTTEPDPITQRIRLCDREDRVFSQDIHRREHLSPGVGRQRVDQLFDVHRLLVLQHAEHRDLNERARRVPPNSSRPF